MDFFIIKWGNSYFDTFNYGSEIIKYKNNNIYFKCPLMPAGLCIKRWKSQTQFHSDRESPSLPLLHQSKKYYIKLDIKHARNVPIQAKISFFDVEQELIEEKFFQKLEGNFVFPLNAVSYTIEIINKNVKSFTFKQIILMDYELFRNYKLNIKKNMYFFQHRKGIKEKKKIVFSKSGTNILMGSIPTLNQDYIFMFESCDNNITEMEYLYEKLKKLSKGYLSFEKGIKFSQTTQNFQIIPEVLVLLLSSSELRISYINNSENDTLEKRLLVVKVATILILGGRDEFFY